MDIRQLFKVAGHTYKNIFLGFLFLGASAVAQTPPPWTLLFEAQGPVDFAPLADGGAEQKTKSDFSAKIFRGFGDTHRIEVDVDVSTINQAILPTDAKGQLTPEAKALNTRPYVKFYLPNGIEKTVDVRCNAKICKAALQPFPYNIEADGQKLRVEVNIRGLSGKNWELNLSRFKPSTQNMSTAFPRQVDYFGPASGLTVTRYHQKNSFTSKNGLNTLEPDFVDEWVIPAVNATTKQKSSVGPMFIKKQAKIELFQGELLTHYSVDKKTLIKERIKAPVVLWLEEDVYVYVENDGSVDAKLRWIEFSEPQKPAKSVGK